ncbi:hypothetical protein B0T10DRAFT_568206 [Thelonectria olida]|uniref:MARVEL domain-containing protein n=1 Tax=Thelonectria olida TaxID=1576542 RepID=A0A9P8VRS0_9HYPO|nr:hypothetical protein B0T10DRAFT_568206 [Thelonectria olida]
MPSLTTGGKRRRHGPEYPFLPLLAVYVLQSASFLVVIPAVSYFVFHLHNRHLFLHLLSAAAYFTILQLLAVNILSCFCRLPLLTRLVINASGCALWAAGFVAMAAYDVRRKLLVRCSGHLICSLYKVLFAFAAVGLVAAILAVLLDVYVLRRVRSGYENIKNQADGEQEFPQGYHSFHSRPQRR